MDEIEARIYGFLEKNADRAFTTFEIYMNLFIDKLFRVDFKENNKPEDRIGDPLYQNVQKSLEKMVKEEKIVGKYGESKFYYAVYF